MKTSGLWLFISLLCLKVATFAQTIEVLDSNSFYLGEGVVLSKTSFRGLSVVDDNTIWASGSRGTIARSTDGGKIFRYTQLKGYEKSDFRDIEAFDDKRAIIMSSGTPAYILKTTDGGETWKEVYKNMDSAYFLDAMDFWDEQMGILVGDPVNGHFLLLQTSDGGETWIQQDKSVSPKAREGEAVFAASGTSLRCYKYPPLPEGEIVRPVSTMPFIFVTGGKQSKIISTTNKFKKTKPGIYRSFTYTSLPITQGKPSQGAFSLAYNDKMKIIVGGDYYIDTLVSGNSTIEYWQKSKQENNNNPDDVRGYRSCVEAIDAGSFIACGTSGVDLYNVRWKNISEQSFHVVRKARNGKVVFLAGAKGRIGKLVY